MLPFDEDFEGHRVEQFGVARPIGVANDDDIPAVYLLYAVLVILAITVLAAVGIVVILHQ